MSSPSTVRHRGGQNAKKRPTTPNPEVSSDKDIGAVAKAKKELRPSQGSEWDYKITITIITILAFATRFYGISHPNQVVFDEVHFGKV
jgi:dolichyl-phosphate-mannose-protein mannosyltransferase